MIARGYVENGARVYVASRKKQACDEVAAELGKTGTCFSLPGDIATEDGVKALAAALAAPHTPIADPPVAPPSATPAGAGRPDPVR